MSNRWCLEIVFVILITGKLNWIMVISYSEKQRSNINFRLILDYKSKVIDCVFFSVCCLFSAKRFQAFGSTISFKLLFLWTLQLLHIYCCILTIYKYLSYLNIPSLMLSVQRSGGQLNLEYSVWRSFVNYWMVLSKQRGWALDTYQYLICLKCSFQYWL